MTDKKVKEEALEIKEAIPGKNQYEQPIWQGILDLLEQSGYGDKDASVEMEAPLPPGVTSIEEFVEGGFDGPIKQVMAICHSILGDHGTISVNPYSKGPGTRSLTVIFKAKSEKVSESHE